MLSIRCLRYLCRLADLISEQTAKLAIWAVLALVFIFCWEVVLRGLFNKPTLWAHELSQYFFGFYFALGGAYCMKIGGMVRVDTILNRFKPRARAGIESLTGLAAMIFLFALVWTGIDVAWDSIRYNETSISPWGPPIYPIKIIALVGSLLLGMQSVAQLMRSMVYAVSGKELG